ncbi:MAG: hypothetical protein JKY53_10680 [Flavobacteriales bacterium]|nr:hypothetical protein [Flavobacteriales bacterium]
MKYFTSILILFICLCFSSYGQQKSKPVLREKQQEPTTKKMVKAEPKIIVTKQNKKASVDYSGIIALRELKQTIVYSRESNDSSVSLKREYCKLYESCSPEFITGEDITSYKTYLREINPKKYEELFPKATSEKQ